MTSTRNELERHTPYRVDEVQARSKLREPPNARQKKPKSRERTAFAKISIGEGGRPGRIEVLASRDDAELNTFALSETGVRG